MKASVLVAVVLSVQIINVTCGPLEKSTLTCAIGINRNTYGPSPEKLYELLKPYLEQDYQIEKYVSFKLYTSKKKEGEEITLDDVQKLKKSNFDSKRPTKIITHGYLNYGNSPSCKYIQNAFLNSGDYNVIVIDWWNMQSVWAWLFRIPLSYKKAVGYVPEVAKFVASMIEFLESNGMNLQTTTLIGHSLGAHVMGIASHQMKNKVNYIVGLDPALPRFESKKPGERLSIEDASIVEVIHTNEGHCGMSEEIGHYDFYPNGGSKQPGCWTNQCAHGRAYEYYAESISSKDGFYGFKCSDFGEVKEGNCTGDVALMGGMKKRRQRSRIGGLYRVETRKSSPYAKGK